MMVYDKINEISNKMTQDQRNYLDSTFDESFFKFKCLNVQSAVLRVESKASSRARLFISLCLAVPQSVVRASNGANPICIQSLAVLLLL